MKKYLRRFWVIFSSKRSNYITWEAPSYVRCISYLSPATMSWVGLNPNSCYPALILQISSCIYVVYLRINHFPKKKYYRHYIEQRIAIVSTTYFSITEIKSTAQQAKILHHTTQRRRHGPLSRHYVEMLCAIQTGPWH